MHKHLRLALATASAAALTGGLLTFSAVTATAADSVHQPVADFNDDGFGDVAYSAGNATVGGKSGAGQIVALYGSASGVTSTKRTTISQNTTGVPGSAETGDGFGWVSAYGDYNGDGFDDLAVSAQTEDVDGDTDGGTVAHRVGLGERSVRRHHHQGPGGLLARLLGHRAGLRRLRRRRQGGPRGRLLVEPRLRLQGRHQQVRHGRRTLQLHHRHPLRRRHRPTGLSAGDVNGDKRTDLVVNGYETDGSYDYNTN